MTRGTSVRLLLAATLSVPLLADVSEAVRPVERHDWVAGVAYGVGPADIDYNSTEFDSGSEKGASPQFRLGKMIGNNFMIGIEDRQWLNAGGVNEYQLRGNIQNFDLVLTTYPGNGANWTSGFLLHAGVGYAHARVSALAPYPEGSDEYGNTHYVVAERDENGLGLMIGGGYELRVSSHFAVGAVISWNYLDFEDEIFDKATFIPGGLNLNWYF